MSTYVTAPLVAAGTASVTFATTAETSFAKVGTIADTTVMSMDDMRSGVMGVSDDMGVAVTDFNEALYQTISATGDTANAIDYTTIAAKAAKGGFTDTATAVDGLTTIMNSYGLKGADAMEQISDQMLIAQNYGKTTFGELASSMGQVVPIAAQLNIGTDTLLGTMAVLTKNGIGTSEAVTGLKAALSNIVKPSSEASEAAEVLGLDFSAAALQSKGFSGFMGDVKTALENASPEFAAMSERSGEVYTRMAELAEAGKKNSDEYKRLAEEAKGLEGAMDSIAGAADSPIAGFSTLFGSVEGLNSMLVLTSDVGIKDMEGAMDSMSKSTGATQKAFDKMDSTPAAKMQKELNKLKNVGIDVGSKLLPLVTKGVEFIGKLTDAYNKLSPEQQDMIVKLGLTAAAAGPVIKTFGGVTEGLGKFTGGIGKLLEKAKTAKTPLQTVAGAVGGVAENAAKAGGSTGILTGALSALTGPAGIAALAAGAIIGIGTACYFAYQEAKKNDLAEHFGNVKLSAEEVETTVDKLTTTDWTMRLDLYTDAKNELEELYNQLDSAKNELKKETWKISIGLTLTEEEKGAYKGTLDNFVDSTITALEQAQYTAKLSIDTTLTPGTAAHSSVSEYSSMFYEETKGELLTLGKKLAESVDKALADNIITSSELHDINEIQSRIQKIMDELAERQYQIDLKKLSISAQSSELSVESFNALIDESTKTFQARFDAAKGITAETLINLEAMLSDGTIDEKTYNEWVKQAELNLSSQEAIMMSGPIDIEVGTLKSNYSEELGRVQTDYQEELDEAFSNISLDENWYTQISEAIDYGLGNLDGTTREQLNGFLEKMEPQKEQLERIRDSFIAVGEIPPVAITKSLEDIYYLEQVAGSTDNVMAIMAQAIADSPEKQKALEASIAAGIAIPTELSEYLKNNYGLVFDATKGQFEQIGMAYKEQEIPTNEQARMFSESQGLALSNSITEQGGVVSEATNAMLGKIPETMISDLPVIMSMYTQAGIDIPGSFITSLASQAPDVQLRASELINQLLYATEAEKPAILEELGALPIEGVDALTSNMNGKQEDVKAVTQALFQLIGSTSGEEQEGLVDKLKTFGIELTQAQIDGLKSKFGDLDETTREGAQQIVNGFDTALIESGGSSGEILSNWADEGAKSWLASWEIQSPSKLTGRGGKNVILGFNNAIDDGRSPTNNIMKAWATGAYNTLDRFGLPGKAKRIGSNTGGDFNIGINSQRTAAYTAGRGLSLNAVSGINSVDSGAGWEWGYDLGSGLANGLWAAQWKAASAASSIASTIRSYLHFSRPDVGPLRDYETYMPDFVYGLTDTLKRSRPMLISEVENTSGLIADAMKIQPDFDPQILSDAAASIDRCFMPSGEMILKLQFKDDTSRQVEALSADMAALRRDMQSLVQAVNDIKINGINGDSIAQGVKEAVESADIKAIVDRRQAGQALYGEIDKNQGYSMAMKKRGV